MPLSDGAAQHPPVRGQKGYRMARPTDTPGPRTQRRLGMGILPFIGLLLYLAHIVSGLVTGATDDWPRALVEYGVFYLIGWAGIGGGISHVFFAQRTSASIGWAPSPFETEIGFANLGFGIAGVLAPAYGPEFWWAVIIANSVFRVLAGALHVREIVRTKNYAVNNTSILLIDFGVPLFLVLAYLAWA
jgi:hypothetical protein